MNQQKNMQEVYIQIVREALLHFFALSPGVKIMETSELTKYGNAIVEENAFVSRMRKEYHRKDKTWKLSLFLNEYVKAYDHEKETYVQTFLDSNTSKEVYFKTNISCNTLALYNKDVYPLQYQSYLYDIKDKIIKNELVEIEEIKQTDILLKSKLLHQIYQQKYFSLTDNFNAYKKGKHTKYSLVEDASHISLSTLCNVYETLQTYLETYIYELFSIISLRYTNTLSKQKETSYYADFELMEGMRDFINIVCEINQSERSDFILEALKKEIYEKLPFEVYSECIKDEKIFVNYMNQYLKQFVLRKKESIYAKESMDSLDFVGENQKGEKMEENYALVALSLKKYSETYYETKELLQLEMKDDISTLSMEKAFIDYMRSLLKKGKHIDCFMYMLINKLYEHSLTKTGVLNKHGSAFNNALYALRMMYSLRLKETSEKLNEEQFLKGVEKFGFERYSDVLLSKWTHLSSYEKEEITVKLNQMLHSISSKEFIRYDQISRARNNEKMKVILIESFNYAMLKNEHDELLEEYTSNLMQQEVCILLDTNISENAFSEKYRYCVLKVLLNENEEYSLYSFLIYALYLKYQYLYQRDISSFVKMYPSIDTALLKEHFSKSLLRYTQVLNKTKCIPITVHYMQQIEMYMVNHRVLQKAKEMILYELG